MSAISLHDFADRLLGLMPVIIRETAKQHEDEVYTGKITPVQYVIMSFLAHQGVLRMTDLAHSLGVTTAATTGTIDRLVRCKYVERLPEPHDRRIIKVRLTGSGEELVNKITRQRRAMIMSTFGKLSVRERRDYLKILERVRDILEKGNEA
jgi:DNA-binding MarR family transcriptional regulator